MEELDDTVLCPKGHIVNLSTFGQRLKDNRDDRNDGKPTHYRCLCCGQHGKSYEISTARPVNP